MNVFHTYRCVRVNLDVPEKTTPGILFELEKGHMNEAVTSYKFGERSELLATHNQWWTCSLSGETRIDPIRPKKDLKVVFELESSVLSAKAGVILRLIILPGCKFVTPETTI